MDRVIIAIEAGVDGRADERQVLQGQMTLVTNCLSFLLIILDLGF